jgi:hypothetical protein
MPRTQGVDTNPKNANREIGSYNHSLTYQGTGGGRGGASGDVTTNRTYVLVGNYQSGSLNLFSAGTFGERGSPVASKDANGRWQVSQTSGFTQNEIRALQTSLNSGTFGKKLNNEAKEVATRDLGADQYKKIFNPSVASTSENGSTSGGGTNPPAGSSSGGGGGLTPEEQTNTRNFISQSIKAKTQYPSAAELKYPISYEGNDYLEIQMIRYVPESNLSTGANPNAVGDEGNSRLLGGTVRRISERSQKELTLATITLPMPSNLVDANPVDWGGQKLDPLSAYAGEAGARLLNSPDFLSQMGKEVRNLGEVAKNQGNAIKPIMNTAILSKIIGLNGNQLLTRSTGAILNPNFELLFGGPGLRNFTFSFKMTPRDQKEARNIKNIIRSLKQGMSVKRAGGGIFLASPNIFKLQFYYAAPKINETNGTVEGTSIQKHPFLPVFKPCALQSISVNYMPDGSYMTYGDGSMVAYDMALSFGEIEPIFDEDYDETNENGPGQSGMGY